MPTAPLCVRQGKPGWRGPEAATVAYHCRKYTLATPNYGYEKRQRELAKKKKQDEKDARKREARAAEAGPESAAEPAPSATAAPAQPGPRVHLRKSAE